jgi:hypothetical protein
MFKDPGNLCQVKSNSAKCEHDNGDVTCLSTSLGPLNFVTPD